MRGWNAGRHVAMAAALAVLAAALVAVSPRMPFFARPHVAERTSGLSTTATGGLPATERPDGRHDGGVGRPAPSDARPAPSTQASPGTPPAGPIRLHDVTAQTGITFVHTHGGSGKRYIVETVTAGLATVDYDGDGLIDVYFPNGRPLPGTRVDKPPRNALYRNLGHFHFREVTDEAGVGDAGYGMGVAVADYDNDGHPDLYVSNFGPNVLYRNNGNGTFTDVTRQAGVGRGHKVGAGACFLDMDGDGNLDLYAANYVKFSYDHAATRYVGGYLRYPGPRDFEPEPDNLFRNNGDGTFTDVSRSSGVAAVAGTGMGMVACDYDNDGDTDVFVVNDVGAKFLFRNDGNGHFEEVGLAAGVAYNFQAAATGSMGVDCGDYDNDGWLDFFVTTYQGELPTLYKNLGRGLFEDVTVQANAGASVIPYINWGCGFVDFDNDGHKDLFLANGHLEEFIDKIDPTTAYAPGNTLLRNTGDGRFVDVTKTAGDGMLVRASARGAVFDDLDNDGRVDVVILNSAAPATILRNETVNGNHWIQLRLAGVKTNRDGVGARVRVVAGELVQIDEVHSGRGYQSHWGSRLHFGLGKHDRVDRVEVRWIGGGVDVFENPGVDRLVALTEGTCVSPHQRPGQLAGLVGRTERSEARRTRPQASAGVASLPPPCKYPVRPTTNNDDRALSP